MATQAVALLGLYLGGGRSQVAAVALLMLLGASVGPVFMATQSQVLHVAPGRTEIALAANSAAFNAGVAAGALTGGAVLHAAGVRGTFLVGALLTLGALAALTWPATGSSRARSDGQGSGSAVGTIGDW